MLRFKTRQIKDLIDEVAVCLKRKDQEEADRIVLATLLLKLQKDNQFAQKTIRDALQSVLGRNRHFAVSHCHKLGRRATFAAKELEKLKLDFYPEIRRAAIKALKRIDDDTP